MDSLLGGSIFLMSPEGGGAARADIGSRHGGQRVSPVHQHEMFLGRSGYTDPEPKRFCLASKTWSNLGQQTHILGATASEPERSEEDIHALKVGVATWQVYLSTRYLCWPRSDRIAR
jgi:hypothetical protein